MLISTILLIVTSNEADSVVVDSVHGHRSVSLSRDGALYRARKEPYGSVDIVVDYRTRVH